MYVYEPKRERERVCVCLDECKKERECVSVYVLNVCVYERVKVCMYVCERVYM